MGCKPVAKSILHEIDLDRHEWNKNDQSIIVETVIKEKQIHPYMCLHP